VEKAAQNAEMKRFNAALRRVVRVSKTDLNRLLSEERAQKAEAKSVRATAQPDPAVIHNSFDCSPDMPTQSPDCVLKR